MKKYTLIVTLIAAALLCSASAYDPTPTPGTGAGCLRSSWNPELYSFYGAKDTIVEKLAQIPAKLSERRVFLQVTQGVSKTDVKRWVREDDGIFTVTEWTREQPSRLHPDDPLLNAIDKEIVDNKGVHCVGEQVQSVLGTLGKGTIAEKVPAPVSPKAAFAHSVNEASGDFIKTTIIILC